MKKLYLAAILLFLPLVSGCASCRNEFKHIQSNFVGLHRKVTLYGATGTEIRSWIVKAKVEDQGGTCYFITPDGRAITVSGTFVIEEVD